MLGRRFALLSFAPLILGVSACRYDGPSDFRFDRVSQAVLTGSDRSETITVGEAFPQPVEGMSSPVHLQDLLDQALNENPDIEQARLVVESLGYRIEQALGLPDPMLGTTTHLSQVQTAAGQQDFGISLSQKVIRRNKRDTRAAIAEDELNAARATLKSVEQKVVEQISSAYYELGFIQECLAILEADKKELELIDAIVDRRFRILKEVTQQETLQVQVAVSKLEAEIDQYKRLQKTLKARLCRLTHSAPGTEFIVQALPQSASLGTQIDDLISTAIQNNPELHSQLFEIRRQKDTAVLANLNYQPDFTMGMNWISTATNGISPVANGNDAFMLTMGMNLPVYRDRIDAGIREAQIKTLANTKKYESLKDEKAELITEQVIKFETESKNLELFRTDIIPKQKLTWDQSIKNYEVGKTDFLQMIDNWRKLLQYEILEQRMIADLHKTLAMLNRLAGVTVNPKSIGQD